MARIIVNEKFKNALAKTPQACPPIWFMRQAGRYHWHYQKLKEKHDFSTLCLQPELAAQVALGPVEDFDFDVSILFSDILFPLDAMGFGLHYTDRGPILDRHFKGEFKMNDDQIAQAVSDLKFQAEALKATREVLPKNKSLIGFVGGIWTLFVYAVEGSHAGHLLQSKNLLMQSGEFLSILTKIVEGSIANQLGAGAEVVMIFDTAAGEVSPQVFQKWIAPYLMRLVKKFPGQLGYYSKGTQKAFFTDEFLNAPWTGFGFDHKWNLPETLKTNVSKGFTQGNFDQALLFLDDSNFKKALADYIATYKDLSPQERAGWVSGLGHGVLPKTPEKNVRLFIETIRESFT